ncbi:MAG: hypothetical protein JNJ69_02180 [Leptospiraceae bacterium]|nr:hypothetical protein [Leptospiraceae bacterium]
MDNAVKTATAWNAATGIVTTTLSGPVDVADVKLWRRGLEATLAALPSDSRFRIYVNFFGLAPQSVEAHKSYRAVIPLTLSRYGWRVGYLALFPEADNLPVTTTDGIRCTAAVHVHQDTYKIEEYDRRFGTGIERFFSDPHEAETWLTQCAA